MPCRVGEWDGPAVLLIPAHSLGGSGREQTDGDEVDLDGKRTGFPGVLGGLYGPVKGVLQCGDASFEASISAVDGQRGTGQATSDTALRMACSNASGGWAPVIR